MPPSQARSICARLRRRLFSVRVRSNYITPLDWSRSVRRSEGWTAEAIGTHAVPALRADFHRIERSPDVFGWTLL